MPECVNGWLRIVPSMRQLLPRWNGAIVMRSEETHFKFIGCLFIIYFRSKVFEYKKRSIKILVYSSVIDIDQMAGCDLFCSNFYERLGAICVGRFNFLFCFVFKPHCGVFVWTPGPRHRGALFAAFPKQNDKCLTNARGMGTLRIDWAITQAKKSLVSTYDIQGFSIKRLTRKFHVVVMQNNGKKVCCTCKVVFCCQLARSTKSIKISIDISGKSDLIDIDCIDKSIEIDETLVPFIHLSRFLPTSSIYIGTYICSCCWQLRCSWLLKNQTIITFKKNHLLKPFLFFQTGFKIILWWLILAWFAGAQFFTT